MIRRFIIPVLVTLIGFALLYMGHTEGIMLAGGGPCVIIINDGNQAYGAIEEWEQSTGQTIAVLARLKAAIQASCALVSYGSLYLQHEGAELKGMVLTKIISFHQRAIRTFRAGGPGADYNIEVEAKRLEKYNRHLAIVIADEDESPYPVEDQSLLS